ncbi:MAG: hypothetical protein IT548_01210 [Alphaproteobacteria bacterium]|nr:hypothetical protein [Alphaproteobacteria bacterium]
MAFFRLIAIIFIVAGLLVVGFDIISSLQAGQGFKALSLESLWTLIHAGSLEAYKNWVIASVPEPGPGISNAILGFPAFAVFGVIGILLGLLFQRRARYDD